MKNKKIRDREFIINGNYFELPLWAMKIAERVREDFPAEMHAHTISNFIRQELELLNEK